MEEKLTLADFKKAKKALEDARIPEPWVITPQGIKTCEVQIKNLEKYMEEMAGKDPKDYGKRQPGEMGMYERHLRKNEEGKQT